MKRTISFLTAAALTVAAVFASGPDALSEPVLRFHDDGTFKIVQLTDLHYKHGKGASRRANQLIDYVLDKEQPDLVLITGDLFYSDNIREMVSEVFPEILDSGVPFGIMFGNHDEQHELKRPDMYDLIQALPGSVMPPRGDRYSPDYVVEIAPSSGDGVAATLYCLDSHATTKDWSVPKYAWLEFDQIDWYRTTSKRYKEANDGKPVPSLMFLHIPLPEYAYALRDSDRPIYGYNKEKVCCPAINSGMFTAIIESGDVKGVFCGHDHDNDFAAMYYGVLLAYGRYSGGKTVYNHLGEPGARVIVLHEGSNDIETYIRLLNGDVEDRISFPDSFLTKKELKNRKR